MITPSATAPELTLQQTKPEWSWPRVVELQEDIYRRVLRDG